MDCLAEKTIEQALVKATKDRGGICPKFTSPGMDGMPDLYLSIENCATFQLKIAPLKRDVIHHFTLNRHPLFY